MVPLVMVKSRAKTMPVCRRRTLTLGEHLSTPPEDCPSTRTRFASREEARDK